MSHDHKADEQRVTAQNSLTDITRTADDLPQGGGLFTRLVNGTLRAVAHQSPYAKTVQHSTDFGETTLGLNQLLDLVEQTDPHDLASSGQALWDARDAIKSAAEELAGHINNVRWVGKAGEAFRAWGGDLVGKTLELSDFAGGAGDQLAASADGLASVRSAMPPRDTEADRKRPHEFSAAEKAANKEDYAAAVKVEKNRQEAINQMNRLASYYAVSNEQLTAVRKKAPTFDTMPDVGVPKPDFSKRRDPVGADSGSASGTGAATVPGHHPMVASAGHPSGHDTAGSPTPVRHVTGGEEHILTPVGHVPVETPDVGTGIDSVGTLPPPTTTPQPVTTPPVTGGPAPNGGPTGVFEGGLGLSLPSGTAGGGSGRAGGFRMPASSQGRIGTPGPSASGTGRLPGQGPTNQMGRATATGQSMGKGVQAGARSSSAPMGRGVSGGTPRTAGTQRAVGRPTTGAGRGNGVVGGRPTATGGSSKGSASRLPRGTVIGAEEAAGSRSQTGRPAARGVFGAPESAQKSGAGRSTSAARGGAAPAEGVTGRPAARNSAGRAERNGLTRGGVGLVRGSGNRKEREDERDEQDAPRPDHRGEESETTTHPPTEPRRDVPSVSH
ncbi:hypothetical protein HG826_29410 [Streptomyces sp. GMY01]|uniref:hypothetical protein n=1 Tax=Streptomyces sp. GMY02 TaxID=1333528 RepID=UPI00146A5E4A|nr:hypothetical protein [Streptomyces sp. GMY02]NMO37632.1 hypothetical protein [Streptomyces sp. GMY02]